MVSIDTLIPYCVNFCDKIYIVSEVFSLIQSGGGTKDL